MQILKLFLLLSVAAACHNSPGVKQAKAVQGVGQNQFHPILSEGTYSVEFYTNKEITTEQKLVLRKTVKLIERNKKAQEFYSLIAEGNNPTYNPASGISRNDYNLLTALFSAHDTVKQTGRLQISREGNLIKFRGEGKLSLLDSVFVDISRKSASFKHNTLSLDTASLDLSQEDVPAGEQIESYEFYKGPGGILGLTGMNGSYELLIGKLIPGGKIYLTFFAKETNLIEHPVPEYITLYIKM
jgi:hypothetical protein